MNKMIYTPPDDMPKRLKILWRTHKPVKTLAEASEAMGMKSQYFGQLCNGRSLCTVESVLKIAAFFDVLPTEIDPNFPVWAMHTRNAGDTVIMPMEAYTPSDTTLQRVQALWTAHKDTGETLETTAPLLGLAVVTLSHYLTGRNYINVEFVLKFATLMGVHPQDIDAQFPAHFLVSVQSIPAPKGG